MSITMYLERWVVNGHFITLSRGNGEIEIGKPGTSFSFHYGDPVATANVLREIADVLGQCERIISHDEPTICTKPGKVRQPYEVNDDGYRPALVLCDEHVEPEVDKEKNAASSQMGPF